MFVNFFFCGVAVFRTPHVPLFEMRIVVIQDSEDGKRTVCKKCTRKIVNCYRMFAELRETLAGGRALDEAKDL